MIHPRLSFFPTNKFLIRLLVKKKKKSTYLSKGFLQTTPVSLKQRDFFFFFTRQLTIREYLTLPSYTSFSLVSTEELSWHCLPAAEAEGLGCCRARGPAAGMPGRRGAFLGPFQEPEVGQKRSETNPRSSENAEDEQEGLRGRLPALNVLLMLNPARCWLRLGLLCEFCAEVQCRWLL